MYECLYGVIVVRMHIWLRDFVLSNRRNLPPQCLELFKWRQHAENHYIHIHHICKRRVSVCFFQFTAATDADAAAALIDDFTFAFLLHRSSPFVCASKTRTFL